MNKKEFILYLMEEYKGALLAIEAEEEWQRQEDERVEKLKEEGETAWIRRDWYSGRHVSKAELNRIRLMMHKAMLEVEEGEVE